MLAQIKEDAVFRCEQVKDTKIFYTPYGLMIARPGDWAFESSSGGYSFVFDDYFTKKNFNIHEEPELAEPKEKNAIKTSKPAEAAEPVEKGDKEKKKY